MADIIQISEISRLKKEIDEKNKIIDDLMLENKNLKIKVNSLNGIKDLLKLQIEDLKKTIQLWKKNMTDFERNLGNLQIKLPD